MRRSRVQELMAEDVGLAAWMKKRVEKLSSLPSAQALQTSSVGILSTIIAHTARVCFSSLEACPTFFPFFTLACGIISCSFINLEIWAPISAFSASSMPEGGGIIVTGPPKITGGIRLLTGSVEEEIRSGDGAPASFEDDPPDFFFFLRGGGAVLLATEAKLDILSAKLDILIAV